jgi:pimeloyl-ACP methyl ester carboxylesterase
MQETRLSPHVRLLQAQQQPNPGVAVIAFGGIAQGLGVPVFEFYRTLEALGTDALFVRDPSQSWYQKPIEGFGDTPHDMAAHLDRLIATHFAARRILAMGNSMGGWAAALFGCLCELDAVIAISPQTFISRELRARHADSRWAPQLDSIGDPAFDDLAPVLERSLCDKVDVYVGASDELDMLHAKRLAHVPGVRVKVLDRCGHDAARHLRDQGLLRPMLQDLIAA